METSVILLEHVREKLVKGEGRQQELGKQEGDLSRTDSMHRGELATAFTVNQTLAPPNLSLSCVQVRFQPFPLPVYLYLSASQSVA